MARRGPKLTAPPSPTSARRPDSQSEPARRTGRESAPTEDPTLSYVAERFRRLALGLTAALITARAFFPSEPNIREGAGDGLVWVLLVFVVFGIAMAVPLLNGRLRFRWSATDAFVIATMTLVVVERHPLARSPPCNQPGRGMGRSLLRLPAAAQPPPHPRRIVGPGRAPSWPRRWPSQPMGCTRSRLSFPCFRPSSCRIPTRYYRS